MNYQIFAVIASSGGSKPCRRELLRAYEPLAVFGDGGFDCGGDRYDQGHSCSRAEIQSGAHFVDEHRLCRFYRVGGAIGRGLYVTALVHEEYRLHDR